MTTYAIKELEEQMLAQALAASRAMREATLHLTEQAMWDIWQAEERRYTEAHRRWLAAKAEEKA